MFSEHHEKLPPPPPTTTTTTPPPTTTIDHHRHHYRPPTPPPSPPPPTPPPPPTTNHQNDHNKTIIITYLKTNQPLQFAVLPCCIYNRFPFNPTQRFLSVGTCSCLGMPHTSLRQPRRNRVCYPPIEVAIRV